MNLYQLPSEAAISPGGDAGCTSFVRKTVVREWQQLQNTPGSQEQLAGEIQRKTTSGLDGFGLSQIATGWQTLYSEWTAGSAGTHYETLGPDPTVPRADLTWETDHELAYATSRGLDVAPW